MMNQHALYYDGILIGIIMNPDNYPGGIDGLCNQLSPDEGSATAVEIPIVHESTNKD